jgi:hypothetical protein
MELRGESDVFNAVDCRINDFFGCVCAPLERSVGFECIMFSCRIFTDSEEAIHHRACTGRVGGNVYHNHKLSM